MLRFVLEPERREEVVDPVEIASTEFGERLLELGHGKAVRLFNYSWAKSTRMEGPALVIEQDDTNGRHRAEEYVRVELSGSGGLILEANVTGRSRGANTVEMMHDSFVIDVRAIEAVLGTFFRFSSALFAEIDPHQRQERFFYNVGLRGLGYRSLERDPRPKQSYATGMRTSENVSAFPLSRSLARAGLKAPGSEIERTLALLERAAQS